jgi:hypothetical protein
MTRYHRETRQTSRIAVAGMTISFDITFTDADSYLAQRIIERMRSGVTSAAAESYARVSPWQIRTVTTEESNTAAFDDVPVITLEFACSNYDTEQGA